MSNTCFYCDDDAEFICHYHAKKMKEVKEAKIKDSAPLMLEALKKIRDNYKGFDWGRNAVEIAQAAIDAAEGKEVSNG